MSAASMVKSTASIESQKASCLDCGWTSEGHQHFEGARRAAYQHTAHKGHRTKSETVKVFHYEEDI